MSVASADAALLSAARAYASLKMTFNSNSASSSSIHLSSTPSTPTPIPPTQTQPQSPSHQKKQIYYSRSQLLALHDSPLCLRPPDLKPLKDWFGEIDPNPPKSTPSYPPSNSPLTQRNSHFSPEHASHSLSQPQSSSLPVLGRSQPPARNPFANFGKFGAEEPNSNSFSLLFNGPSTPSSNSNKHPRRLIDRDCAPHIARPDQLGPGDGPRRRTAENPAGLPKDRVAIPKPTDENPDPKPVLRRTLDRYVPDRDRDDDRLRERERERERDRERDRTTRSNHRDPNLAPTGEDNLNWRRPSLGSQHNNKRSNSDHHPHPRSEKDGLDTRDRDHPAREKDPARLLLDRPDSLSIGHHPLPQHPIIRNPNQARSRDKDDNLQNLPSHQLVLPTGQLSRGTPPISPVAPMSAQLPRRVKDGPWDSGEGKWEMSKHPNGPPGVPGYGATSETDAIQTWKAEMKALEAKRKLAGTAAGLMSPDQTSLQSNQLHHQLRLDDHSADHQHPLAPDPVQLDSKTPDRSYSSDPLPPQFAPSDGASQTQFGIPTIDAPSSDHRDGARSIGGHEDDLAGLPRASRFAKFFDSQHKDGIGSSSTRQGPVSGTDAQAEREIGAGGHDAAKLPRSASADPENMARVLSMLQMSSKQTLEPTPESAPSAQSNALASQSLNKLVPSNVHPSSHSELASFLQQHSVSSPPKSTPSTMHSAANLPDLSSQRANPSDDARRIASSAPGVGPFAGFPASSQPRTSQHSSPVNQMGALDELPNHHLAGEPFQTTPNAIGQMGFTSQPVHGALSASAPFSLFSAPPHAGQPKVNATDSGLRSATGVDPQLLQLQHMLNAVGPQQHIPQHESQKLAFLSRQLQQHRMMPTHLVNQAGGAQTHPVGPAQTVSLQQGRQLEALEHQRRFAQTTGLQALPAAGAGLNPMLGGFSGGGVPMVGGPLQAGPALVLPGGSGLNFLGGHGQGSHGGMVAVNFGGAAGGLGGVRGGGGGFGGAGAQRAVGPTFGGAGAGGAYGPFMGGQQFGGGSFGTVVVPNQTQAGQPGGVGQHHLQQPQAQQQAGQSAIGGQQQVQQQGPFGSFLSHHHHAGIPQQHQQQQHHHLNQQQQQHHQLNQHQLNQHQHQLNQQQHQLNQLNQQQQVVISGSQAGASGGSSQVEMMSLMNQQNHGSGNGLVGSGRRNNVGM